MSEPMFFEDANVTPLADKIERLPRAENDIVLLLIAEHSLFNFQELLTALNQRQVPFAGGVFPGVIYGGQKYEAGVVADVLPLVAEPSVITGLETASFRLDHLPNPAGNQQYTALVLVDGLTKHIGLFLDRLFKRVGNKVRYIGGGAGSLSFQPMPCVFDHRGFYQDAALVLWLKTTSSLGVRHGWKKLHGPFMATVQASGTTVDRLDNSPALRVYSQMIKTTTGKTLTKGNFFAIAKEFPLGIYRPRVDHIVRDPIGFTDDDGLVCVGEVSSGSLIYILHGNKQSLIDNAHLAASEAAKNGSVSQHNLIVDCISRVLYLEDEFGQELDAVLDALPDNAPIPYGMLSLGEIATFETGRVEFFNKTIVVGSLQEA